MNSTAEQLTKATAGEPGSEAESEWDSNLAGRLLEIVPRATRRIRRQMRAHGTAGLTVAQLRAMIYLRREPGAGLSALADHLGMSLPASSALAQRLVVAGMINRTDDPAERRRIRLELTPSGADHLETTQAAVRGWLAAELAALTPAEQARLAGGLELLARIGQSSDEPARHGAD
jgi:DNA-binding MarR family transcriptional regulator